MQFLSLFLFISLIVISTDLTTTEVPNASISNGIITANLYLPDIEKGYYRSTRFDWSGVISKLEYKGHNYFGQWFDNYEALKHDAIMGPVYEFGEIGYKDAKVGENFLKIGVGMLKKASNDPYNSFVYYDIENHGERLIIRSSNSVEFVHLLSDSKGYAYEYRKIVKLTPGKPELVINCYIKNKGKLQIRTTVYNHNFFVIDNQQTGTEVTIEFPFKLSGSCAEMGYLAKIENNKIIFLKSFEKHDRVRIKDLKGYNKKNTDNAFLIENKASKAGVKFQSDQPLTKLDFWACITTLCPEPYIKIDLAPGKEFCWENKYEFYTL